MSSSRRFESLYCRPILGNWRLPTHAIARGERSMEPTRRRSGVKGNLESLDRLRDEIKTLRAQLTKAKATIARLSQGNGSQIRHSPTANLMARRFESLSPRERDIVRLYLEDPCDKKVARQLGTKPQT